MICQNCGAVLPDGSAACTVCGAQFTYQKVCARCGEAMGDDWVACPKCGTPSYVQPPAQPYEQAAQPYGQGVPPQGVPVPIPYPVYGRMKNKWVAFLLCLFLGVIGVHKFYEGKIGMGILYIFTAGLFGIGVLVDLIVILTKPNPYFV